MSEVVNGFLDSTNIKKLWAKDSTLWTNRGEEKWLGWLDIVEKQILRLEEFKQIQIGFKKFKQVALLGMGGSSLGPEVLAKTFGHREGFPKLSILDSTDADQVLRFEKSLDLKTTCFIVASKSGSTLEPNIFLEYFFKQAQKALGSEASKHFIAITDPGSNMEKRAKDLSFANVYYGQADIGGRYSILSDFGLIPALSIGIDIEKYLFKTLEMVKACKATLPVNPGVALGLILGEGALKGQNKMTLISSPELRSLPSWVEQLVAESTGKGGQGIIPVVEDELGEAIEYGSDRLFIFLKYGNNSEKTEERLQAFKNAGHQVTTISTPDLYDLGAEFFRWEIATAVAGAILKVNPFDQPDVEAGKTQTKKLTQEFEKTGILNSGKPFFADDYFEVCSGLADLKDFNEAKSVKQVLVNHFKRLRAGDYIALLCYIDMNSKTTTLLNQLKHRLQNLTQASTCVGFGPRFLHSTGQAYKGGPNTGVFLQIMGQPKQDLAIPNHKFTFDTVLKAQALGDFEVLVERKRRALQLRIKGDLEKGLEGLINFFSSVTIFDSLK